MLGITSIFGWFWNWVTWSIIKFFQAVGYISVFCLSTIFFFFALPMLIFLALLWSLEFFRNSDDDNRSEE